MVTLPTDARHAPPPYSASLIGSILLLATALRLLVLSNQAYPLAADEAQYWVWSRHLSFGYFSKPPFIAWLIRYTTDLFGEREFGVRFAAPVLHGLIGFTLYFLGRGMFSRRVGFWAALIYISLPAVSLSALLISTDIPLLLFWSLALWFLWTALQTNNPRAWIGLGLAFGLGTLSKYAMVMFIPSALLYFVWREPTGWRRKRFWAALMLGLLIYAPNLIWNMQHNGVSYSHTLENASLHGEFFKGRELKDFLLSQFAVFGPSFFALLLFLLINVKFRTIDRRRAFLIAFILPQLIFTVALAFLSHAHANWAVTVYLGATLLIADWAFGEARQGWLFRSWRSGFVAISLALQIIGAGVAYSMHDLARLAGVALTRHTDPYRRLIGPASLGALISEIVEERPGTIIMTDDRGLYGQLSFYVKPSPTIIEWNWDKRLHNHFEMISDIRSHADQPILFVTLGLDPDAIKHFSNAQSYAVITIPIDRDTNRRYYLYTLQFYHETTLPADQATPQG